MVGDRFSPPTILVNVTKISWLCGTISSPLNLASFLILRCYFQQYQWTLNLCKLVLNKTWKEKTRKGLLNYLSVKFTFVRPVELQWHQLWVTRTTNIQCCQTQIIITTAWQDKIIHCCLGFMFSSFSFWFCITIHKSCLCWSTQLGLPHRWIITCWKFTK